MADSPLTNDDVSQFQPVNSGQWYPATNDAPTPGYFGSMLSPPSEQGGVLETHNDVPDTIRDQLYAEESLER
jgi:hypothetical protein